MQAVYVEMLDLAMALKTSRWARGTEFPSCMPGKHWSTELSPLPKRRDLR